MGFMWPNVQEGPVSRPVAICDGTGKRKDRRRIPVVDQSWQSAPYSGACSGPPKSGLLKSGLE